MTACVKKRYFKFRYKNQPYTNAYTFTYTHIYIWFYYKKENYSKYNDLTKSVIDSQATFIFFFNLLRRILKELSKT